MNTTGSKKEGKKHTISKVMMVVESALSITVISLSQISSSIGPYQPISQDYHPSTFFGFSDFTKNHRGGSSFSGFENTEGGNLGIGIDQQDT